MDFDFQISFAEKHPAYTITPMTGNFNCFGSFEVRGKSFSHITWPTLGSLILGVSDDFKRVNNRWI